MAIHDSLTCDVLVIGAGMAGLTAAGYAAERGATVVVVEKARAIGGSAALSGGILWTATSPERLRRYGGGRPELGAVVLRNYRTGLAWLRRRGIAISPSLAVLHGRGYQIDILDHLRGCVNLVEHKGGHVVLDSRTRCLVTDERGTVTGAQIGEDDNVIEVVAGTTILATGGYQNSADLRARHIHPNARDNILLRSNPVSQGDGLRLAADAGGHFGRANPGFYGHLVSESPRWGERGLYTLLTQYHSDWCLLLNEQGQRFCDESEGDHTNTNRVLAQSNARALCFWDAAVHREHATAAIVLGTEIVDKMAVALEWGGNGIVATSLAQVESFATSQRFDGAQVCRTVEDYNQRSAGAWESLDPPRAEHLGALAQPPYYALVVRPAITHTHGGLAVDEHTRVLRRDNAPIRGLLAAGADVGDVYGLGYAGGLALALSYGIEAASTAGFG